MIRSSFASFNTARMAIQANQAALGIVGHNMANAKTLGYTRQRLDQISLNSKYAPSMYMTNPDAYIGYGVMITGVSQIRDPFLDTRYRIEMGNLGTYDKKAEILESLGSVFDETGRTGLDDQFTDLFDQLTAMNNDIKNSSDSMVRSSSEALCNILRKYSQGLKDVGDKVESGLENDVKNANDILKQIEELNKNIKSSQVCGNPALELQDERNNLIDQLATYADIRINHGTDTTITGNKVDILTIDYVAADGTRINLINDTKKAGSLSLVDNGGKKYLSVESSAKADGTTTTYPDMTIAPPNTPSINAAISSKGTFQVSINMLNSAGEFDSAGTDKGIPYYQKVLDEIARSFAENMNGLNNVEIAYPAGTRPDPGNPGGTIPDPNTPGGTLPDPAHPPNTALDPGNPGGMMPAPNSGDLFATNDGSNVITASNISISKGWLDGTVKLQKSKDANAPSKENSNILNMMNALNKKITFNTMPGDPTNAQNITFYTGTFQECFTNMTAVQSMAQKSANSTLDNCISIVNEISDEKDSVSGVSIDEEAMNMMQYNSALTAASRYMTTLDEALNTIINNMGVVGR